MELVDDPRMLRLRCLELALGTSLSPRDAATAAGEWADFVSGENDAEVLRAARDLAKKVSLPT